MFYIYFNGEFYYVSNDTHYKHGEPISNWYPDYTDAHSDCRRLNEENDAGTLAMSKGQEMIRRSYAESRKG